LPSQSCLLAEAFLPVLHLQLLLLLLLLLSRLGAAQLGCFRLLLRQIECRTIYTITIGLLARAAMSARSQGISLCVWSAMDLLCIQACRLSCSAASCC
jgi:hypothetical protein